uniref:NADH-ubiquinone oxidoreductase chain 4 n=1 Tax=Myrsidea sp. ADS-2020 TaxID=2794901 RepID=A0A7T1M865_9NEOP|nr:NADH dehydrogenase subunit 4 [Myrsidea sp. ADS-2020]
MFFKIKLLILVSILVPFYMKRFVFEFLCTLTLISIPLLWSGWDMPVLLNISFMMDKLSSILMILSLWTAMMMLLLKSNDKFMNLNIILLLMSLLAFFSVSSLMSFFVLFETSLVPTLCLILGWGYQPERLEASYYFVFYTIVFSIPLLVSLMWLVMVSGSKYFYFSDLYKSCSSVLSFLILCVFLIKLPMFMVHFWLPKAHVEAPVVGSMVLAGVLLKTGGYGIVRVTSLMKKTLVNSGFMILSLIGMIAACFVCLYCIDLKQVIAFSSVSHMNFMITGLMVDSLQTFTGSVVMMVSHGLCSSLMFMLADLSYKRCNSRSALINKGFLMVAPILSLFWSVAILFNMGVPPSAGSLSELLIITVLTPTFVFMLMYSLYLFFSAFYSVCIYMTINHGISNVTFYTIQVKESLAVSAHLIPLTSISLMTEFMSV